jgi:hypothetical protein
MSALNVIGIVLTFVAAIRANVMSNIPAVDLGYALHKATVSSVRQAKQIVVQAESLSLPGKLGLFSIPQHPVCCTSIQSFAILDSTTASE